VTLISRQCKRLAEVDFPISLVSHHAAREKSIRHGHPSTLHLWWARRPLASTRAMLISLLLPDPGDALCPAEFKQRAREILARTFREIGPSDEDLRKSLLEFIADLSDWDRSNDTRWLIAARSLIRAANGEVAPLVADPFAGGGSIPLEALRLGCDAFASDLNPVATLVERVLLEDLPRAKPGLGAALRSIGEKINQSAKVALSEFYPQDPDGAQPLTYLWARTVRCESPNCGAEIPLARSFLVATRQSRKRAVKFEIVQSRRVPHGVRPVVFEPRTDSDTPGGTVSRAKATCLNCGAVLPPEQVRAQLREQRGGAEVVFDAKGDRIRGAMLLAVVTSKQGSGIRTVRSPTDFDYSAVWLAQRARRELESGPNQGSLSTFPNEPTPVGGGKGAGRGFAIRRYGMTTFSDLFTSRQLLAISTLLRLLRKESDEKPELTTVLAMLLSKCVDYWSANAVWANSGEFVAHTMSRNGLPIVWDFAEACPWVDASGSFQGMVDWVARVVDELPAKLKTGQVELADASSPPLPDASADVWFTDPPYYDAVPYADLSDFFYVWLKRLLPSRFLNRDPFDLTNPLTPKDREAIQDDARIVEGRKKDRQFFEDRLAGAFSAGRRTLRDDGIGCVVFAHKTTEGWESLLSGMIKGGWKITSSWPIATERPGRLHAQEVAALATSVHLVCRPRPLDAPVGEWAEVARELPMRVKERMDRLSNEGVRGADLVFACIGPAIELYSRYSKVVDAQDREIPLGGDPGASDPVEQGFLAKVWEVVGRIALEQILGGPREGSTSLEEDSRLTALFLWALQATRPEESQGAEDSGDVLEDQVVSDESSSGGYSLVYDVVRRFAQPLGIHLDMWEGRIIETSGGIVRLLPISARMTQLFDSVESEKLSSGSDDGSRGRQTTLYPEELSNPSSSKQRATRQRAQQTKKFAAPPSRLTTLDRLHRAMLLQANGASTSLREYLREEKLRGPDFERLARALTALYPKDSEERRLVEALSLAIPN
jgi:putative DNA methylase